jgi:hypothetical protein
LRRIDELCHDLAVVTGASGSPGGHWHPSKPLVQQSLVQGVKAGHGAFPVAVSRHVIRGP